MKKNIIIYYFFSLLFIFVLSLLWEFILEPYLQPLFMADYQPESGKENWEYIKTTMVLSALALLIPCYIAAIRGRQLNQTIKEIEELQKKTAALLDEKTIELESISPRSKNNLTFANETNAELRKTNVTLQTIIDSLTDSIMVFDLNYNLKMINRTARDIYIVDPDDPSPLSCYNILFKKNEPCSGPDHLCPVDEVKLSKKQITILHDHINKDGMVMPVEVHASPIFDESGEIIGIIESARDISFRLAEEEERKESEQRFFLQQREQSIATLAGGIAHEFNNVLTSVIGNAELLNINFEDKDPKKIQTDDIIKGSLHLADLTRQLLAYAKGGKYQNQKIAINKVIKDSLALTHTGKFAGMEVRLNLNEDIWPFLGDPVQISQLVMNILINGFEALETGAGFLEIHTENVTKAEKWYCRRRVVHPPGEYVQLIVTNTGSEIPEEYLDKIFDPFFSTKFTGRGMGLAAAIGIVQNHDGCIGVESSHKRTSFQVLFPKVLIDKDALDTKIFSEVAIKDLRVLVVDDEPQILSIIEKLLTHHGCQVITADSGRDALEIIKRHINDLDLVILDIQMPGMSGDEVYTKLKALNPAIRVLITSGHEEYTALQNIDPDLSRDRFIKKPFSMVELLHKLKGVLIQK